MNIQGTQFIGYQRSQDNSFGFQSQNPANGEALPGLFYRASAREVDEALQLAATAFL